MGNAQCSFAMRTQVAFVLAICAVAVCAGGKGLVDSMFIEEEVVPEEAAEQASQQLTPGSLIAATKASAQGEASALKKGTDEIVKKIENLWKKEGDLWNKTKDKMNKAQRQCNEKLATMQKNLMKRYKGKEAS